MKALDHPNVIRVFEYYIDEQFIYIVTELCNGGELFEKINKERFFSEQRANKIMQQLFNAINYCHKMNIVHRYFYNICNLANNFYYFNRDLKPENILLSIN